MGELLKLRVANVPAATFDAAIERPKPATVTEIADMERRGRPAPPAGFKQATSRTFASLTKSF
jgi:hypothetical protein